MPFKTYAIDKRLEKGSRMKVRLWTSNKFDNDGMIELFLDEELFMCVLHEIERKIATCVYKGEYDEAYELIVMRSQMVEKLNERDNTSTD